MPVTNLNEIYHLTKKYLDRYYFMENEPFMFQFYLLNLIKTSDKGKQRPEGVLPARKKTNRRAHPRHDIDHKHIVVSNEDEFLKIKNISFGGFCTHISHRGFSRMRVGDVYRCRIRYLKTIYTFEAEVRWKRSLKVGFQIITRSPKIENFLKRIIRPMEIGSSLVDVSKDTLTKDMDQNILCYHGLHKTTFIIYPDSKNNIKKFTLLFQNKYLSWQRVKGFSSGIIKVESKSQLLQPFSLQEGTHLFSDQSLKKDTYQFSLDCLMCSEFPFSKKILEIFIKQNEKN